MSAEDATSSSEASSAREDSPALLSISSATRVSIVWAAMIRQAVTGSVWPIRCTRSMACVCSAEVHDSSASTTFEASWRLRPSERRSHEQELQMAAAATYRWQMTHGMAGYATGVYQHVVAVPLEHRVGLNVDIQVEVA